MHSVVRQRGGWRFNDELSATKSLIYIYTHTQTQTQNTICPFLVKHAIKNSPKTKMSLF